VPDLVDAIKSHLKSKTQITGMIGAGAAARIYYEAPKQGVDPPFVTLFVFDGESYEHVGGIVGIAENRVQIDAYGANPQQAYDLAEFIRLSFQTYRGTAGGLRFHNVSATNSYERTFDRPEKGSDRRRYTFSRDYFCTYEESTITI
jgi:hypothetical protein